MTVPVKAIQNLEMRSCFFAITYHSHFSTLFSMPTHRLINSTPGNDYAGHYRLILSPDRSCLQLRNQVRMGLQCLSDDHQTRGVLIKPMNNSCAGY